MYLVLLLIGAAGSVAVAGAYTWKRTDFDADSLNGVEKDQLQKDLKLIIWKINYLKPAWTDQLNVEGKFEDRGRKDKNPESQTRWSETSPKRTILSDEFFQTKPLSATYNANP